MTDEELHRHLIGQQGSRRSLNTPVLVVELDALDRNISRMAAFAARAGLALRPHAKTHKCPDIARRQLAAGAIGICCAKLGEAEVLADAGIGRGLHLTSPVVSPPAIARLAALNARTEGLMSVVDHPANAAALGAAMAASKPLEVSIDIDPGIRRTGVASADAARIEHLCDLALEFAQNHLKPDGALLVKCFHGSGYSQIVEKFKQQFKVVAPRKPKASRDKSSETFILGRQLKHPR